MPRLFPCLIRLSKQNLLGIDLKAQPPSLSRCTSSAGLAGLPKAVLDLLEDSPVTVAKVEGAGRGLIALQPIPLGTIIHMERPFVCHPVLKNTDKVCYHCLAVLSRGPFMDPWDSHISIGKLKFCSEHCLQTAEASYLDAEVQGSFKELEQHCERTQQKFPLLVKRLACSAIEARERTLEPHAEELDFLAFANLPSAPPDAWVHTQSQLQQGLESYCRSLSPDEARSVQPVRERLDLQWYLRVLARLHINTVRVDCIFPPAGDLRAIATSVIAGEQEASSFSGSALYIAASLFNHSCSPNVDISFPLNNSEAVFTAATSISKGEELCISYVDSTLPREERQRQLLWGYGFHCQCQRCRTSDSRQ